LALHGSGGIVERLGNLDAAVISDPIVGKLVDQAKKK
jgi:hypothetical protein